MYKYAPYLVIDDEYERKLINREWDKLMGFG